MKCEEARELITALVDDELTHVERSSIETHLDACPRCQWSYEQERALKKHIHRTGLGMSAPADLERKILTDHGILPVEAEFSTGWSKLAVSFRPFMRPVLGLVLVLLVLLPIVYLVRPHSQPISLAALEIHGKIAGGEISLRKATTQNELRDWQTRAVEGKFTPMEYDLSSMHVRPVGGLVQEINGRKILVTVYTGNNMSVTCFTFLGTEEDAPKNAGVFFDTTKKIKFYTFSKEGFNAVLHREGDVICLLVSKMSVEELLTIATAKIESS
jgi:mycothiol system anti-sigma-R factor